MIQENIQEPVEAEGQRLREAPAVVQYPVSQEEVQLPDGEVPVAVHPLVSREEAQLPDGEVPVAAQPLVRQEEVPQVAVQFPDEAGRAVLTENPLTQEPRQERSAERSIQDFVWR